ncbi:MAG: hypothetical protein WAX69_05585 [Victivallales bacterium]
MAGSGQAEIKADDKGFFKVLHTILAHISYRYHISLRLKIYINSLIVAFPAFIQYILFDEPEYLISFVLCFGLAASTFLVTRAYPFPLMYDSTSYMKIVAEMKESERKGYLFNGVLDSGFREKTGTLILIVGESS